MIDDLLYRIDDPRAQAPDAVIGGGILEEAVDWALERNVLVGGASAT